jgi:hypothetical protein
VPTTVTAPVASIVTGVFVTFGRKLRVQPLGMFTVV